MFSPLLATAIVPESKGDELLRLWPAPEKPDATSGHRLPAGIPDYEKNDRLANMRSRILAYRAAERHPAVQVGLQIYQSVMAGGTWRVVPADDERPECVAYAEHIARSLGIRTDSLGDVVPQSMTGRPWERRVLELLLAERYGWHWWELVCHDIDGVRYTFMLWRDPGSTFAFIVDSLDRLVAIRQLPVTGLGPMVDVPMSRVLLLGRDQVGTQYDGIGLMRGIEPMTVDSNRTANTLAVVVERWGAPTPVVEVDWDAATAMGLTAEQAKASQAEWLTWAENYISGERQGAAPPPFIKITAYDGEKAARSLPDLISTLDAQDRRILTAFLAQFLQLGASGSGGSYSLGEVHSDALAKVAENTLTGIGEQMDSYIKRAIAWQFGEVPDEDLPRLEVSGIRSPMWVNKLSELVQLVNAGLLTPTADLEAEVMRGVQLTSEPSTRTDAQRLSGRGQSSAPILPTPKAQP